MGNPAYVWENLAADATISVSTEDASYPKANLVDGILANPFRFTGSTGGYIELDFGVATGFDTVAILGHNLQAFTDGTINVGSSPNPGTAAGVLYHTPEGMWADIGEQLARYMRITLTDVRTDSAKTQIGELVVGVRRTLPRAARWGIRPALEQSGISLETYGGRGWDYEHFNRRRIQTAFRFPKSERPDFELLATRAVRTPFLWIPDSSPHKAITVELDIFVSGGTNGEVFLHSGVNPAVSQALTTGRNVYTFSGFTDTTGIIRSFRIDPATTISITFHIYSVKIYAGSTELRRFEPADFAGWTTSNIDGLAIPGYWAGATSTSNDPQLIAQTSIGYPQNAFYVKRDRNFAIQPVGPATDHSEVGDWYDWAPEFIAESAGLVVNV